MSLVLSLMRATEKLIEAAQVFIADVVPTLDLSEYEDLVEGEKIGLPDWIIIAQKKIPIVYNKVNSVISLRE